MTLMRRSLIAAALLLAAAPLLGAPLVKRLVVNATNGTFWSGRCPHRFDFRADITSRHSGQVTVQWLRSDGGSSPPQVLRFARGNETRRVYHSWTITRPYRGWEQLRVTDAAGYSTLSRRVPFTNRCR